MRFSTLRYKFLFWIVFIYWLIDQLINWLIYLFIFYFFIYLLFLNILQSSKLVRSSSKNGFLRNLKSNPDRYRKQLVSFQSKKLPCGSTQLRSNKNMCMLSVAYDGFTFMGDLSLYPLLCGHVRTWSFWCQLGNHGFQMITFRCFDSK